MIPLVEPGKSYGQLLQSAIADAIIAGSITFFLFCLLLGMRTVDKVTGLTLQPRPALLATAVGIVVVGRFLLNLFVWHADYPITTPFAKLFTRENFDRRDVVVLGSVAFVAFIVFIVGAIVRAPAYWLVAALILDSCWSARCDGRSSTSSLTFPTAASSPSPASCLPCSSRSRSYLLEKAFHLGLPLRYLFDLSILVLTYVMLGWGLNIVVGLAGLLDLGYVAFYAVGAYTFALLATHFGLGFWICLPIAGARGRAVGRHSRLPRAPAPRRLSRHRHARLRRDRAHRLLNWTRVTNGPNGISGIPKPTFFGLPFSATGDDNFSSFFGLKYDPIQGIIFLYYVILGLALITNLVTLRLRRLPIGRAWEAMREDEIACRSLGINTTITKLTAFAIGAMFGGVAGSFFATRQGFISPESFTFIEFGHHPRHRRARRHGEPARRRHRGDRHGRRLRGAAPHRRLAELLRRRVRSRALPHAAVRRRHGGDHGLAAARHRRHANAIDHARQARDRSPAISSKKASA